jgi:hypothetical protein
MTRLKSKSKSAQTSKVNLSRKKVSKETVFLIYFILGLLIIGIPTGVNSFLFAYIKCGKPPVAATNFAAAHSYALPGEHGSGPHPFHKYYCSQAEAEQAGYRHSPLSEGTSYLKKD